MLCRLINLIPNTENLVTPTLFQRYNNTIIYTHIQTHTGHIQNKNNKSTNKETQVRESEDKG
jgi:hypothetical protein